MLFLLGRQHVGEFANDAEHDLVRAAADAEDPEVPVHPADRHLLREAHPAPELEAGVGDLPG